MFSKRFLRDVYVPVKSDLGLTLSSVHRRRLAVTKRRSNLPPTRHYGLLRGRLLGVGAMPYVM